MLSKLVGFTKSKWFRLFLLLITLMLFGYYFINNIDEFRVLKNLSIWQIALIVLGQIIVLAANVFILMNLVQMIGKKLDVITSSRVVAYSSIINFFGFLQGGLGFRAVYLKRHQDVSYKQYFVITLLQYALIFGVAGLLVVFGLVLLHGLSEMIVLGVAAFSIILLLVFLLVPTARQAKSKITNILSHAKANTLLFIIFLTFVQLVGLALAYMVELGAVGAKPNFNSILIYTGIAQFSIIFALTPGAVGIREGMLLLASSSMGISTKDIIVSSTLDRLVYFLTLVIIVPLAIGMRKDKSVTATKDLQDV